MTQKTIRRQSVSRLTVLIETVGLVDAAVPEQGSTSHRKPAKLARPQASSLIRPVTGGRKTRRSTRSPPTGGPAYRAHSTAGSVCQPRVWRPQA